MRITVSRMRRIIKEEAVRLLGEARPQRAGGGERAETGSNLNWLLGLVYTYPGMFNMADLRFALKRHRGVGGGVPSPRDFKGRDANRGYYSSMFADPTRISKYVTMSGSDETLTLNAAGEERISEMFYPQSIPGQEEFEDMYQDDMYAITDRIGAGEARRTDY
jgi:hypothetical protein